MPKVDISALTERIKKLRATASPIQGLTNPNAKWLAPYPLINLRWYLDELPLEEIEWLTERDISTVDATVNTYERIIEILKGKSDASEITEAEKKSISTELSKVPSSDPIMTSVRVIKATRHYIDRFIKEGLTKQRTEMDSAQRKISEILKQSEAASSQLNLAANELGRQKAQSAAMLREIKNDFAESSVQRHANLFDEQERAYANASWKWLVASIVVALVIIGTVGASEYYLFKLGEIDVHMLVMIAISKLIIISILSSFLVFCGRNYFACRHNEAAYRQRSCSLKTFRSFIESVSEPAIRDAIIAQAAQAVFAASATGYLKDGPDAPTGVQFVELVRATKGS